mmetsp:Transcript_44809/g.97424  ORF Transcript_44809/g.97424 Transcript_44809/m.97424 type:complete len:340 (-) Transcript_44809:491-1510(-)
MEELPDLRLLRGRAQAHGAQGVHRIGDGAQKAGEQRQGHQDHRNGEQSLRHANRSHVVGRRGKLRQTPVEGNRVGVPKPIVLVSVGIQPVWPSILHTPRANGHEENGQVVVDHQDKYKAGSYLDGEPKSQRGKMLRNHFNDPRNLLQPQQAQESQDAHGSENLHRAQLLRVCGCDDLQELNDHLNENQSCVRQQPCSDIVAGNFRRTHLNPSTCVIASEEIVEEVHNPIPHGAMTDQHQEVLGVFSGICQDQRDSDQIPKNQQHTCAKPHHSHQMIRMRHVLLQTAAFIQHLALHAHPLMRRHHLGGDDRSATNGLFTSGPVGMDGEVLIGHAVLSSGG